MVVVGEDRVIGGAVMFPEVTVILGRSPRVIGGAVTVPPPQYSTRCVVPPNVTAPLACANEEGGKNTGELNEKDVELPVLRVNPPAPPTGSVMPNVKEAPEADALLEQYPTKHE